MLYGRFHPGRELSAIEFENFLFALKPINMLIYSENVYGSIFFAVRCSSILVTIFTCFTCLKWPLDLAINENNEF